MYASRLQIAWTAANWSAIRAGYARVGTPQADESVEVSASVHGWHRTCNEPGERRPFTGVAEAPYQENAMLHYALIFFVVAVIAAVLGFGGIAGAAAGIAKILFFVFLILFVVSLVMGRRPRV
jgi:uncharacterized membrane protein YtjA (UPF0391 family)